MTWWQEVSILRNMQTLSRIFWIFVLICTPILAAAGRPVYKTLDLSDLIALSPVIVIAEEIAPGTDGKQPDCEATPFRYKKIEVLQSDGRTVASEFSVHLRDHVIYREACKTGGKLPSYASTRFSAKDTTSKKRILFLERIAGETYKFVADGASEGISERNDVVRGIEVMKRVKCDPSRAALTSYLATLPRDCTRSENCEAYYLEADSCAAPVILKRFDINHFSDSRLKQLQDQVRQNCSALWENRAVCSPLPGTPACLDKKCVNAMDIVPTPAPRVPIPESAYSAQYTRGTISGSCAPHDAASLSLILTASDTGCAQAKIRTDEPRLSLNIWESTFASGPKVGGDWLISGNHSGMGSLCNKTTCDMLSSFRIKIIEKSGPPNHVIVRGRLENIKLMNGKTIQDQGFEVKWCPGEQLCG